VPVALEVSVCALAVAVMAAVVNSAAAQVSVFRVLLFKKDNFIIDLLIFLSSNTAHRGERLLANPTHCRQVFIKSLTALLLLLKPRGFRHAHI
jgi:hypothetical protein